MSEKTIKLTLSAKARKVLFQLSNKRYSIDKLIDAATLLNKLKEGTNSQEMVIFNEDGTHKKNQLGEDMKATIYRDFGVGDIDITIAEFAIAKKNFNTKGIEWSVDEIDIYNELKFQLI